MHVGVWPQPGKHRVPERGQVSTVSHPPGGLQCSLKPQSFRLWPSIHGDGLISHGGKGM